MCWPVAGGVKERGGDVALAPLGRLIVFDGGENMPNKPLHPCAHPGCTTLTDGRYCSMHQTKPPDSRPTAHERGYTYRWSKASKAFLRSHPWCVQCMQEGRYTPAQVVDHIVPHKGNWALFWDSKNWQPLCKAHHDRKTAREDGGFGTSPRP